MDKFVVSALKYRPQQFSEVVGQQAITQTLVQAIEAQQLPQALLFCGPRGVGKTSCARILAKTINASNLENQPDEDFAFNIFELDAASHNTIDDIRSLNEQVRIPPQVGSHKIYIIDEVHMLSLAAFNAFLKTLEEPPAHVIFILATTEKQRLIPTILSRCQIFDFKRIEIPEIKEHLAHVADQQQISYEDEALHIIAQKADGAMRDALSIFDRMANFCRNNLTAQDVAANLNMLDPAKYFEFSNLLVEQKIPEVLLAYDDILKRGFEGSQFLDGLASHFRLLFMAKNPATHRLLEVSDSLQGLAAERSQKYTAAQLIQGLEIITEAEINYPKSKHKRLTTELCLMQLASLTSEGAKKK